MNITAIRQRPQWFVIGTVILAAVIGGGLRVILSHNASSPSTESAQVTTPAETEEPVQLFESPMISLSAELRKAATPSELVRSTQSDDRLSVVTTGRLDPFAPITQTISATTSPSRREAEAVAPPATVSTNREPLSPQLPTTSISRVPDLPPVPVFQGSPPALPSIPLASSPLSIPALPSSIPGASSVPQSPVDAVELTGVVQVGDRVGVIVREGNGQSSRHVFAGDLLAGGQVRVKSVDVSAQQPLVILEYRGQEFTRVVS